MALIHEFLRLLPRNHLSRFVGRIAAIEFPQPVQSWLLRTFVSTYKIALDEVADPLNSFTSLRKFFIRDLRAGVRPIAMPPVSPVDGFLRSVAQIESTTVTQVKGREYALARLLGDAALAEKYVGGQILNFYLAPPDYHHVHSPVSGTITQRTHIPGTLWPVNDWSLHTIDGLFCVNERVVICIQTDHGVVSVVMVGATNVGEMRLSFDDLVTNSAEHQGVTKRVFDPAVHIRAGDRLGTFLLGSTAVVVLPKEMAVTLNSNPRAVRYGQALSV